MFTWRFIEVLLVTLMLRIIEASTCTVAADCSGHASGVSWNGTACVCECINSWAGSSCGVCPVQFDPFDNCGACDQFSGYGGHYPNCTLCTSYCSSGARRAEVNTSTGECQCICRNQFYGVRCELCPPFVDPGPGSLCSQCYTGYADINNTGCSPKCTIGGNCSGHAISVQGTNAVGCSCTCSNAWNASTNCAECPMGVNATDNCGSCIAGFSGFPTCSPLCTLADCSPHAAGVSGTVATGCVCICRNAWTGPACNDCPPKINASLDCGQCIAGYVGYPNCTRQCTSAADCNDHASHVSGTEATGCRCFCRNNWTGAACDSCPMEYDATRDCGACSEGYTGYPNCQRLCTPSDCSNHSISVTGVEGRCICQCRNGWSGPTCAVCPVAFRGEDCDACSVGFVGYPSCIKNCTVPVDCSGHASTVQGFANGTCRCTCRNGWEQQQCEFCPYRYNRLFDCLGCNATANYEGNGLNCVLKCTVGANCSGHAIGVTGNTTSGCQCQCRDQWHGGACEQCAAIYDSNCSSCAVGYDTYPSCFKTCTAQNCSYHATSVTGNTNSGCNCTCAKSWSGSSCATCAANYNVSNDCGTCAEGYVRYPGCYLSCTTLANCSNHATTVSGDTGSGCNCTCRNQWYGSSCSLCPPHVNSTADCSICDEGYADFPRCLRVCTNDVDCEGHATSVDGLEGNCTCHCKNQWTSSNCATCASIYNASADCGQCTKDRTRYPLCFSKCTISGNCSGHAIAVSGNVVDGCNCTCDSQWRGDRCQTCPSNYNTTLNCATCAEGFADYPTCARICTPSTDCNDHAINVTGLYPHCACTCRTQWTGATCSACPPRYDAGADCAGCAVGYDPPYPACPLRCTNAANCSGHASAVGGDALRGCQCACRNAWDPPTCADCPPRYDAAEDCGACAAGYADFPRCAAVCTVAASCGGHATGVEGWVPNCTCECRNRWEGDACEVCPLGFDPTLDCGACAAGYNGYPMCSKMCTNAGNCSAHASRVTGNARSGCNCTCRTSWYGALCDLCPAHVDPHVDCAVCKVGYVEYPRCLPQCTPADCANHSIAVSGGRPECVCVCANHWAGADCGTCPPNYDVAADCQGCAMGYETPPHCYRICTLEDCSNHASEVSGNIGVGCRCDCLAQWLGTACEECPERYNATEGCNTCAKGYVDYPNCTRLCTIDDCGGDGHATAVSGVEGACVCTCRNRWTEPSCAVCPSRYDTAANCGACAHSPQWDYPNCTASVSRSETVSMSISKSDSASESKSDSLSCSESGSRSLSESQNASVSRIQSVSATSNSSKSKSTSESHSESISTSGRGEGPCNVDTDCGGHATAVQTLSPGNCRCLCRNQWLGIHCVECPSNFNTSRDCGACSEGWVLYPRCVVTLHVIGTIETNRCVFSDEAEYEAATAGSSKLLQWSRTIIGSAVETAALFNVSRETTVDKWSVDIVVASIRNDTAWELAAALYEALDFPSTALEFQGETLCNITNVSAAVSPWPPCTVPQAYNGCVFPAAPLPLTPPRAARTIPIVASIVVASVIATLVAYVVIKRPSLFCKQRAKYKGTEYGKYTIEFLHTAKDAGMEMYAMDDAIQLDDL